MNTFRLGIIGRCLACQPWMQPSDIYHRQLKVMLQERTGITLRVSIVGNSDQEPCDRMRVFHTKKPLNGVLFHMRHATETQEPLLYKKRDSSGKLRYSLHPQFFKRFLKKEKPIYKDFNAVGFSLSVRRKNDLHNFFDNPPGVYPPCHGRKFLGIPLRKMNLWAGNLCGLNTPPILNEWSFFENLRCLCEELNIPLFVLGPLPTAKMLETKKEYLRWERKCKIAEKKLSKMNIPHYFLRSFNGTDENYKIDKSHLTSKGHSFLANSLYPSISSWIKSIHSEMILPPCGSGQK